MENAQADGLGAGFFQGFHLTKTDEGGEFVAFADDAFGSSRASGHGPADDVVSQLAKVGSELLVSSFELG